MKKIFQNIDKPLFFITVLLFIFGLIMVFSASNVTAFMSYDASPYNFFIKQGIFLIGGFILFLIMIRFNTKVYGMVSWIGIIAIGILLSVLLVVGQVKNQAVSWFDLGFLVFNPVNLPKLL